MSKTHTRATKISRHSNINEIIQTNWWETCVERHAKDSKYITGTYDPNEPIQIIRRDDAKLDFVRFPSYSKFKT